MKKIEDLAGLIKSVFASQRFAVLATQSDDQPYSNLVAFAEADELRRLVFVTSRDTRKYTNARLNNKASLLIDSRTNQASDLQSAVAITALGTTGEVDKSNEAYLVERYTSKHPQLADFLHRASNALMEVLINEYVVATFEGVSYLHMDKIE